MKYNIGSLVMYCDDGDLGIITDTDPCNGMCRIQWNDGKNGWHLQSELEVLCE